MRRQASSAPYHSSKLFVRDHYLDLGWDQQPPAPRLPTAVIDGTRARYIEGYEMLSGNSFDEWYGAEEA
jgi:phosphoribosylaminoimidazole-succinocarboxamide synthase